jgi:hypothetical protein
MDVIRNVSGSGLTKMVNISIPVTWWTGSGNKVRKNLAMESNALWVLPGWYMYHLEATPIKVH